MGENPTIRCTRGTGNFLIRDVLQNLRIVTTVKEMGDFRIQHRTNHEPPFQTSLNLAKQILQMKLLDIRELKKFSGSAYVVFQARKDDKRFLFGLCSQLQKDNEDSRKPTLNQIR